MSERRLHTLAAILSFALVASWLALAIYFMGAPLWFQLGGPWHKIWRNFQVDPPAATWLVSDAWQFARRYAWLSGAAFVLWIAANVWLIYRTASIARLAQWSTRALLFALPLAGAVLVLYSVQIAPRQQLARLVDVDKLPQSRHWPEYAATATDPNTAANLRRHALRSMELVGWLENFELSSPSTEVRDDHLELTRIYLDLCQNKDEPNEMRLVGASQLLHNYLLGQLSEYPADAPLSRDEAYQQVTEVYLEVVQAGGPQAYSGINFETLRPGDWAKDAFRDLPHTPSLESRLAELTQHSNPSAQAEAKAGLKAIGAP